ncbi:hypothetical protein [Helicobacter acinonychis]
MSFLQGFGSFLSPLLSAISLQKVFNVLTSLSESLSNKISSNKQNLKPLF